MHVIKVGQNFPKKIEFGPIFYLLNEFESLLDLIEWGVPQGSVLGPLLLLIFINDIPHASDLGTWLFADDTVLVSSAFHL